MMAWVGDIGWAGWAVMVGCMLVFWMVVIYLIATMFRTDRADGPARLGRQGDPLRGSKSGSPEATSAPRSSSAADRS